MIPTTITRINTAKIIDIAVKEKIGPYPYFSEAKKHISMVDNKVKHQSYTSGKIDCINALRVIEDLKRALQKTEIRLSDEVRDKIYSGIELE